MENTPANQDHTSKDPVAENSIFEAEIANLGGYDKNLKRARNWLYIIAAFQLVMGIYEYVKYEDLDTMTRFFVFGIDAGVGVIFLVLAIWSIRKPVQAFLTAMIVYIVINILFVVLNPANLSIGIILKGLIIYMLWQAYRDAKENEHLKNTFGNSL